MEVNISSNAQELGKVAAAAAATLIRKAITENGSANIILATGTSQFQTLQNLIAGPGIDWSKIVMFHLDEYVGLPITHPASFRKYLLERFISRVPGLKDFHLIDGENDPAQECERLGRLINECSIDVALVGIGENGHLAFNDPPADFDTEEPYLLVELDEACRKQQLGEGWFASISEVPRQAISMSIKQIMKSKSIVCSVPDQRKSLAVKNTLQQKVSNLYPASILQLHPHCLLFPDRASAALTINQKS